MWGLFARKKKTVNDALLDLMLKNLLKSDAEEVKLLFRTSTLLIHRLATDQYEFDRQLHAIILATVAIALILEGVKSAGELISHHQHEQAKFELKDIPNTQEFILDIGRKIITGALPPNFDHIKKFFPSLAMHIPLIEQSIEQLRNPEPKEKKHRRCCF